MATHPVVPPTGEITVYATSWCPYCRRLLADLQAEDIAHTVIDVDTDPDAAAASTAVEAVNGGDRVVPTVVFPDGSTATNPGVADVVVRLGSAG